MGLTLLVAGALLFLFPGHWAIALMLAGVVCILLGR